MCVFGSFVEDHLQGTPKRPRGREKDRQERVLVSSTALGSLVQSEHNSKRERGKGGREEEEGGGSILDQSAGEGVEVCPQHGVQPPDAQEIDRSDRDVDRERERCLVFNKS